MMSSVEEMIQRIERRESGLAVIGLGYAGFTAAVAFAEAGYRVTGIDVDAARVAQVNAGQSYLPEVSEEQINSLVFPLEGSGSGRLQATTSYDVIHEADVVLICVPTPLSETGEPDLSHVVEAATGVARQLRPGCLIVLESTVYPGTTQDIVLPILSTDGHELGRDYHLAYASERVDPGQKRWNMQNTPKVVGAVTPDSLRLATALYEQAVERVVQVSSAGTAEMAKLLENTFRAVNIALANELAMMCDRLGIDVWEVIEAASTKPFGFMPFYPGPGPGGQCIPVDPRYLAWKVRTLGLIPRLIETALEINLSMPQYVVDKVADALESASKDLQCARIMILGVAYKQGVSDVRESPALEIIRLLQERGADVKFHDPLVPSVTVGGVKLAASPLEAEELAAADCVLAVTNHSSYNWPWIVAHSTLLVDTRNATKGLHDAGARIVRL